MSEQRPYWNPQMEAWLTDKELLEIQNRKLQAMLKYTYLYSPLYKQIYKEAKINPIDIRNVDDLTKIPLIDKNMLRKYRSETEDPFCGILCAPREYLKLITVSTGTSGESNFHAWTSDDIKLKGEGWARGFWSIGVLPDMTTLLSGTAWHGIWPGINKAVKMLNLKSNWIAFDILSMKVQQWIKWIANLRPNFWFGIMDFMVLFFELMKQVGVEPKELNLPEDAIMSLTSAAVTKGTRKYMQEELNIKDIFEAYAMSDASFGFFECWQKEGCHIPEDLFYFEVTDPETGERLETGERGEFTFTEFDRQATPLIRWMSDDMGHIHSEKCPCGRKHKLKCLGREDFLFHVQNKALFPYDVMDEIRSFPETRTAEFTIIKDAKNMEQFKIHVGIQNMRKAITEERRKELEIGIAEEIKKKINIPAEILLCDIGELPLYLHKVVAVQDLTKEK
ncbi:MAG: phenylacetate--CoA ligase family protein [Candidatus Helarchaeota archaeon]|nr:phenylacetate--CoA ligase family protein [Candidatus Helarchaeota archaeon]